MIALTSIKYLQHVITIVLKRREALIKSQQNVIVVPGPPEDSRRPHGETWSWWRLECSLSLGRSGVKAGTVLSLLSLHHTRSCISVHSLGTSLQLNTNTCTSVHSARTLPTIEGIKLLHLCTLSRNYLQIEHKTLVPLYTSLRNSLQLNTNSCTSVHSLRPPYNWTRTLAPLYTL